MAKHTDSLRWSPESDSGMIAADTTVADWIRLIRAEFLEIPGLQLTEPQVRRLWNLDATLSEALLDALVQVNFLKCSRGVYLRAE